jgi:hypothetical protein
MILCGFSKCLEPAMVSIILSKKAAKTISHTSKANSPHLETNNGEWGLSVKPSPSREESLLKVRHNNSHRCSCITSILFPLISDLKRRITDRTIVQQFGRKLMQDEGEKEMTQL